MDINIDRLRDSLIKVGEVGKIEGQGITRLAFSKEYDEASKILVGLMKEANLEVEVDKLGNVKGKRTGTDNTLPSIVIGSHLDTVKNGGLFDGNLGIIVGLECINYLNENNIKTKHSIEIIAFNAEEGSEMGGTFCSRVMIGLQDPNEPGLDKKLANYGLTVEDVKSTVRDISTIKEYIEMHIEQGAILYDKNLPIGIVEGIVGITRYKITAIGDANHAGTTPMLFRKDPMVGAARLIVDIDRIAKEVGEPLVATVGYINALPGSVNVIPGSVEFLLELRDLDQKKIDLAVKKIRESANQIKNIDFKFDLIINKESTPLDENIINTIEKSCIDLNIPYMSMASGAGHDANAMAKRIPAGMIFVPSKNGKSHCPEEWTDWKDIVQGVKVLVNTVIRRDGQ